MILQGLRVANFKAFGPSQTVPLRPITLLYGANSAGKSSVVHALALAHHAVETGELDTQRTGIGGDSIDLGGFRQYVHRRQRERQVELGFELNPGRLSGRAAQLLGSARGTLVELGIGCGLGIKQDGPVANARFELAGESGVRVERFAVTVDGRPMLSMSARQGGILRLDRLDHAHPVFREVFRGILMLATTTEKVREEDFAGVAKVLDGLVPSITARPQGLFPRIGDDLDSTHGEAGEDLLTVSRGRRREDLAQAARLFLPRVLRDLVSGLSAALDAELRRLFYLGPLRSYPPRHLAFVQNHDSNWFAGGGYAWDIVRTKEDVRRRVNGWLGDPERLKTPYELTVRELLPAGMLPLELAPRLGAALHDLAQRLLIAMDGEDGSGSLSAARDSVRDLLERGPGDGGRHLPEIEALVSALVDAGAVTEEWAQEVVGVRDEEFQDLVLIDKRSGTAVSHRDVGIGVSQVLPVLVSAYASRGRLLAIEQPEIHLHPGLQAETWRRGDRVRVGRCWQRLPDRDTQRTPAAADHAADA